MRRSRIPAVEALPRTEMLGGWLAPALGLGRIAQAFAAPQAERATIAVLVGNATPGRAQCQSALRDWGFEPRVVESADSLPENVPPGAPVIVVPASAERMAADISEVRRRRPFAPICVSGSSDELLAVTALRAGADDYWCESTSAIERRVRLESVQRRLRIGRLAASPLRDASAGAPGAPGAPGASAAATAAADAPRRVIRAGHVTVWPVTGEVTVGGTHVHLSRKLVELLYVLLSHPGRVLSHRELRRLAWMETSPGGYARMTTAVNRIRQAIEPTPDMPQHLLTMRNRGYCFMPVAYDQAAP